MNPRREKAWLAAILALGLAARLVFVAFVDTRPTFNGGDGSFYLTVAQNLANGYGFVFGELATYRTEPVVTTGPLYPAYLALFYILFGGYTTHPIHDPPIPFTGADPWIFAARLGQAVIGALTAWAVYGLARRLWGAQAGLVAAGVMALDPRFIVETGSVYTETVFTCLLIAGLAAYVAAHQRGSMRWYVLAWAALGLAALARPIALVVFPALALHLWLARPPRQALRQTAALAGLLALIGVPVLARHYQQSGDFNVFGSSAASHFWLGAIRDGQWEGLEDFVEARLVIAGGDPNNPPYLRVALAVIAENPGRFLQLVALKLARAYLQPPGTVFFAGPSLKAMLGEVAAGHQSLWALVAAPTFWPKLAIYLFHFGTLGLGVAAMWRSRARWRDTLPPILMILALSGTYALLTIIPRYLFPIMPCFTVFAADWLARLGQRQAAGLGLFNRGSLGPLVGSPGENPYRERRA